MIFAFWVAFWVVVPKKTCHLGLHNIDVYCRAAVERAVTHMGGLDILVHSGGVTSSEMEEYPMEPKGDMKFYALVLVASIMLPESW